MMKEHFVYILECSDKSFYTGYTTDLERRIFEHNNQKYNGYTSKRLPVKLIFSQSFKRMEDALNPEKQTKGWSRKKKITLVNCDFELITKLAECRNETSHKYYNR